jgi:TrmH family RNA methyltransferase
LLHSGKFECEQVLGKEEWLRQNEASLRRIYKGPLQITTDAEMDKISALSSASEVMAVFKKARTQPTVFSGSLVLALDTIQDPGNLGTIIRIADWFGVKDIICSENSVEQYNPKLVQSTMGSLGRVNVNYVNLSEVLRRQAPVRIYATALEGTDVRKITQVEEGILVIGNESKGISGEIMALANEKITIPKTGHAESLNAAVATGIILSHLIKA